MPLSRIVLHVVSLVMTQADFLVSQPLCYGRLAFGSVNTQDGFRSPPGAYKLQGSSCVTSLTWPAPQGRRITDQSSTCGGGRCPYPPVVSAWVEREMHREVLWFPRSLPVALAEDGVSAEEVLACAGNSLGRCFFKPPSGVDGTAGPATEQLLWWHSPVHIVELTRQTWETSLSHVASIISLPAFWNGQDTNNIFHLLVSFLSGLWLHLRQHVPEVIGASGDPMLMYIFDLHPHRPHMFDDGMSPLVPGRWAIEFVKHAFPAVRIAHSADISLHAPVLFKYLHFNLVNGTSWALPSEDLYPPRLSRRGIGPHPGLVAMSAAVKGSLGLRVGHRLRDEVLLIQRLPPAGRIILNEFEFIEALRRLELTVRTADFSAVSFAKQVEAVAGASIFVGPHGQGLFNLIFLPPGGVVVEVPPCGSPLALVYNVAELFGLGFAEILDTSCDDDFMRRFGAHACTQCDVHVVPTAGGAEDLDSALPRGVQSACSKLNPSCDVRSAQGIMLNNVHRAAEIIRGVSPRMPVI